MDNVNYADLGLKINNDFNTFTFADKEIKVLKYLDINNKYDLVMISLQEAEENGYFNDILLEKHFNLNLVYLYTNLVFTDEEKADESALYDCFVCNGFFDAFFKAIEEKEYSELLEMLDNVKESIIEYQNSTASILKSLITDLPKNAEAAAKIVDEFNPEAYQQIVNFAKQAGYKEIK